MSPYRTDPRMSGRHPFEIFTLFLALVTSLPVLFGVTPAPGTIRAVLPPVVAFIWALTLCVGSLVALVGVWWKERATGLIMEQLGLACVGVVCIIYFVVALVAVGWSTTIPMGIVLGFGLSCLWRWRDLQRSINEVYAWEQSRHRRGGP